MASYAGTLWDNEQQPLSLTDDQYNHTIEQDKIIDNQIIPAIKILNNMATTIGTTIDDHIVLIDDLNNTADHTSTRLQRVTNKTTNAIDSMKDGSYLCLIIIFLIVIVILIGSFFM